MTKHEIRMVFIDAIAKQYKEHNEPIPSWLHIGDIDFELEQAPTPKESLVEDCIPRQAVLELSMYAPIAPIVVGNDVHYENIILTREIEQLPSVVPKAKWIPVSERLPNEHQRVIMSTEYASYYGTYHDDGFYNETGYRSLVGISAWMPLPQPYKVEEQGENT